MIKISEKKHKKFENYFCYNNSVNLEMTWIRIHFFPVRIRDPDPHPHQNLMDPALPRGFRLKMVEGKFQKI